MGWRRAASPPHRPPARHAEPAHRPIRRRRRQPRPSRRGTVARAVGELGREIEIGSLDPAWTAATLEVASDGESVIFSSGVADGPGAEGAPDLWRYRPGAVAPELLWRNPRRDRALARIGGEFGTVGIRRHRDPRRARVGPVAPPRRRCGTHPPRHAPGRRGRLEPGAELRRSPGTDRVDGVRPRAERPGLTAAVRKRPGVGARAHRGTRRQPGRALAAVASGHGGRVLRGDLLGGPGERRAARVRDERPHPRGPTAYVSTNPAGPRCRCYCSTGGVVWKEAEPGFSMFNWGRLFRFDEALGEVRPLPIRPQEFVNYPSAGTRFVAAWGADSTAFGVYDLDLKTARLIDRYPSDGEDAHAATAHQRGPAGLDPGDRGRAGPWPAATDPLCVPASSRERPQPRLTALASGACHPHDVERLVQLGLGEAPCPDVTALHDDLADRLALRERLLRDAGGLLVAEVPVERRDDGG